MALLGLVALVTLAVLTNGLGRSLPQPALASVGASSDRQDGIRDTAIAESNSEIGSGADAANESAVDGENADGADVDGSLDSAERQAKMDTAVADINSEFRLRWQREGLQFADEADWLTICRRLSLALVGSGMSLEEIRSLEQIPEAERVAAYREQLLNDKRFADYWAERLARSVVGADEGPFLVYRRRKFVTWMSQQIATNQSYDVIVRQLVTGRGYFTDRPEVNFHTVTMDSGEEGQPDPIRLAGRTTRAFLGMRIDCMQCHDDFLGNVRLGSASEPREGTQHDFHQLASFYSDSRFNILQGIRTEDHPYKYKYLYDDEETEVPAVVPFHEDLLPEDGAKADRLAAWLTHPLNRPAARAIANRTWALMFGRPLNDPVDDIPLHGPLPSGLDRLADAVVEQNWDLRQLIRVVSSTEVFRMDSRADFEVTDQHDASWAVFPLVRLRPEQVARSVVQASRLTTIDDSAAFTLKMIAYGSENDFVVRYGDTGEDEFQQDNITITQRLLMMNGKMVRERIERNPVLNATSHIDMFSKDDKTAIDSVYLTVLNRFPSQGESQHYIDRIQKVGKRGDVLEDAYWVLMNGSELAWNH